MKKLLVFWSLFLWTLCGVPLNLMAEEGVTKTKIHIGSWGAQTGPGAPWGAVVRGMDAYFRMINEEGGIHGRKIIFHSFDDGYNPARTLAGVKQLQEGQGMFAYVGGLGTATGMAVVDYLMERKIPRIGPGTASIRWVNPPKRYIFTNYAPYLYEARMLIRYAVERLGKRRIVVIYQNDEYGRGGLRGAQKELQVHQLSLVDAIPVELRDTDMRPHVFRMKQKKADLVLLWVSPSHAIRILGSSKAIRFQPRWLTTSTVSDCSFMYKLSKGLFEGVISAAFVENPMSNSHPLVQKYKKAYQKYAAKNERWGVFYLAGFGFAEPFIEGLKRAGKDLSRESLITAMEEIRNFKGIFAETTYKPFDSLDPRSRQGTDSVFLIECLKDGISKQLTPWIKVQ
ncbi:MAG: ABC transporter substrate-binding protein [SAR324 cluster bacterium]|uniref:ABC transporter substrate-binding protein n=1 Tax=SAR324 cluster bacterium TaxID=2024889 RepID=A0A2A4T7Z7_9DELT|nr:MAG: ABC transporter substrate-binding protein [SAR324 cluster bacterium]